MFNREYATLRVTPRRFCVTVFLSLHFDGSEEFLVPGRNEHIWKKKRDVKFQIGLEHS